MAKGCEVSTSKLQVASRKLQPVNCELQFPRMAMCKLMGVCDLTIHVWEFGVAAGYCLGEGCGYVVECKRVRRLNCSDSRATL